ncbi:MAG: adenylate/guanylate cyclase domain-containing protein, partial [Acidimicrobiia bacterium]|nr:adenylate/guanylate cyclase domain-containing protein [Acidimicrobiia bacterium]
VVEALDDEASLSGDELLLRADALYWLGDYDDSLSALEEAFSRFLDEERRSDAAAAACMLGYLGMRRGSFAVANGWRSRAEHLLDGEPLSVAHVWLRLLNAGAMLFVEGDVDSALQLADGVLDLATSLGKKSAESLAMSFKAASMVRAGNWKEAMGVIDEATVMAMTSGDDLRMTSDVYCNTISLCRNLGDYKRAGEWTEQADRWMRANSVSGYTGACAVHRAELKRLHGSWQDAEDEARKACVGLVQFHLADYLGLARYEIGEVRRRMGDLDVAGKEFERAYEKGHDAQPGLSLLMADRGDAEGAFQSISAALDRIGRDPDNPAMAATSRARLLPAYIEIALDLGRTEEAAEAVADLEEIASLYESQVWQAAAATGRGALLLQTGESADAVSALTDAWRSWQAVELPYEAARARALLGEARRASGDETGAHLELKAALSVFEQLGARLDVARVRELLGAEAARGTEGSRVNRAFVFTDIVVSTDLVGLIGDDAWQDLLQWHDRTLRAAFEEAGGEEVSHTGDGFFIAFAETRAALDAAVDIQRRLLRHRHEAGFAPKVRIGVHAAEATRTDGNYHGSGVHVAARICAAADGEEILVSRDALDAAGTVPYLLSEPTAIDLKGVADPVEVVTIEWQ